MITAKQNAILRGAGLGGIVMQQLNGRREDAVLLGLGASFYAPLQTATTQYTAPMPTMPIAPQPTQSVALPSFSAGTVAQPESQLSPGIQPAPITQVQPSYGTLAPLPSMPVVPNPAGAVTLPGINTGAQAAGVPMYAPDGAPVNRFPMPTVGADGVSPCGSMPESVPGCPGYGQGIYPGSNPGGIFATTGTEASGAVANPDGNPVTPWYKKPVTITVGVLALVGAGVAVALLAK